MQKNPGCRRTQTLSPSDPVTDGTDYTWKIFSLNVVNENWRLDCCYQARKSPRDKLIVSSISLTDQDKNFSPWNKAVNKQTVNLQVQELVLFISLVSSQLHTFSVWGGEEDDDDDGCCYRAESWTTAQNRHQFFLSFCLMCLMLDSDHQFFPDLIMSQSLKSSPYMIRESAGWKTSSVSLLRYELKTGFYWLYSFLLVILNVNWSVSVEAMEAKTHRPDSVYEYVQMCIYS